MSGKQNSIRWVISIAGVLVVVLGGLYLWPSPSIPVIEQKAVRSDATPDLVLNADVLVENFDKIVFGSEIKLVPGSATIRKWKSPLLISLSAYEEQEVVKDGKTIRVLGRKKIDDVYVGYVKSHLNSLVKLTGLKTEDSKLLGKKANLKIHFVPQIHMSNPGLTNADPAIVKRLARQKGCYFLTWSNAKTGVMFKGEIVVNTDRQKDKINHCLLEELTQSLGMPNDTQTSWPSIFSDHYHVTELSPGDEILLKTLYDSRMPLALPREEALFVAKDIIKELVAQ